MLRELMREFLRSLRILYDVGRWWLFGRRELPHQNRRLRGLSPEAYQTAGYRASTRKQVKTDNFRVVYGGGEMTYWVLELRHTKSPNLGWVPWAVLKGGHIHEHLKLIDRLPARIAGIEDGRIRPVDVIEGQRLANGGITVWGKH